MSARQLIHAAQSLRDDVNALTFASPVAYVYNPLDYAWTSHEAYLSRYGEGEKRVLFLGMNPGPYGMAQTGVPFGEVALVRDWLGIEAPVGKPVREHPKRPIQGFACSRSEVSGRRLWGAAQAHFGTPERLFAHAFVGNYCPLVFMEETGRNRTPDKLPVAERLPLFAACDRHLQAVVRALGVSWVIGVGGFAEERARTALADLDVRIGRIAHPSPANPAANAGWEELAKTALGQLGLCDHLQG